MLEMRFAGQPKQGEVYINNQLSGKFNLEKPVWERIGFDLTSDASDKKVLKVELRVKNPSKEGDDRRKSLGVALSEATFH